MMVTNRYQKIKKMLNARSASVCFQTLMRARNGCAAAFVSAEYSYAHPLTSVLDGVGV
jgi:hypothetical protein